ncbi:hypothetical protein [Filifactor villosus]|uniref:ABC transporter permease n=1 Tax=Filifactor villosus TaxID=29374 RepID=A0ABV9QL47_9FIRM
MLGKLIKYEMKSVARYFVPLYALILISSLLLGLNVGASMRSGLETYGAEGIIPSLLTLILVSGYIALYVITIIMIVTRYSKNLLGDEGYLMMTLPVKTESILHSKWISSMIWMFLSMVVATLSFVLIFVQVITPEHISDMMHTMKMVFGAADKLFLLLILVNMLFGYVAGVCMIYAAISIAHLPPFAKHRTIWAFVIYIVGSNVLGVFIANILEPLMEYYGEGEGLMYGGDLFWGNINQIFGIILLIQIVLACGFFLLNHYILSKKLNLE